MADNAQVKVEIKAEDLASAVLKGISEGFAKVEESMKRTSVSAKNTQEAFTGFSNIAGSIAFTFNNITQAVQTLFDGLTNIAAPAMAMETLNAQFKIVSGSSQLATTDFQFVKDEANRLGMSIQDTAASFIKFATATKNTSMEGNVAKQMFTGFSEGFKALGLSSQQASGALQQISQGLNKGKVQLEDMNIIAENGIPIYEMLATSMGKSKPEIMDMISSGTLLANDVYPKLAVEMSKTFGSDAVAMAGNTAAQLQRLKNGVFELTVILGQQLTGAISVAATFFTTLVNAIKETVNWLKNDALGQGITNIIQGLTALAISLGVVAGAFKIASIVNVLTYSFSMFTAGANMATIASTVFGTTALSSLGAFLPLILAASAAVVGLSAGLSAVADYFGKNSDSAKNSAQSIIADLEAKRKATSEKLKIEEDYQKAVGVSVEKQLKNQTDSYIKDYTAIQTKWDMEAQGAAGNAEKLKSIAEQRSAEISKLDIKDAQVRTKIIEEENKNAEKYYSDGLKAKQKYYEALGKVDAANGNKYQMALDDEINAIKTHYERLEAEAKGNSAILAKLKEEELKDIELVQGRHSNDMLIRIQDFNSKELTHAQAASKVLIAEIERKVAEHKITEQQGADAILQINKDLLQKELNIAKVRAKALNVPGNEQAYKDACDKIAELESKLTGSIITEISSREKNKTAIRNESLAIYENQLNSELNDFKAYLAAGTITEQQEQQKRLISEKDYWDKVLALRTARLAEINPQTQTAEYQKALSEKLAAEEKYTQASSSLKKENQKQTDDLLKASVEANKKAIDEKLAAEKAATEASRAFASAWASMWNDAYSSAAAGLKSLSDAAYNTWASMMKQPLIVADSIETMKNKATEAAQEFVRLYNANETNALKAGAAWYTAYKQLGSIAVEAARVTAEFYAQKVSAADLGEALQKPVNVTVDFVKRATEAVKQLTLLDKSTLDAITAQIDKAKEAILEFTNGVKNSLTALRDEYDNLTLTDLQKEEKRYLSEKAKWQADYNTAREQGNSEAINTLNQEMGLIDRIHRIKEDALKAEIAVASTATASSAAATTRAATQSSTTITNTTLTDIATIKNARIDSLFEIQTKYMGLIRDAKTEELKSIAEVKAERENSVTMIGATYDEQVAIAKAALIKSNAYIGAEWQSGSSSYKKAVEDAAKARATYDEAVAKAEIAKRKDIAETAAKEKEAIDKIAADKAVAVEKAETDRITSTSNVLADEQQKLADIGAKALTTTETITTAAKTSTTAITAAATTGINNVFKTYTNGMTAAVQETVAGVQNIVAAVANIKVLDFSNIMGGSSAPGVTGMARGGNVGGSGIGDNQLRFLDPREWVIRPEAVAHWGSGLMAAINTPWSAAGQNIAARIAGATFPTSMNMPNIAMATGGNVGNMPNMGTIDLNVEGKSYPVQGSIDVLKELNTAVRRMTRAGVQ